MQETTLSLIFHISSATLRFRKFFFIISILFFLTFTYGASESIKAIFNTMKLVGHREKTIDFGYNGTTASLGKYGDVISLSKFHPIQGYCTICPFEQFPGGDDFYNPDIVREYRRKPLEHFATAGSGYGLFVQKNDEMVEYSVTFKDGRFPKIVMSYTDAEVVNDFTDM